MSRDEDDKTVGNPSDTPSSTAKAPVASSSASPREPALKAPTLPAPSLPKGGGAIAAIGEKLAIHAQTGTASFSVPLAVSPGRGGFGPQLALSYDSGAGQSPFGLGWNIGVPSIVRRTDKGLPRYADAEESDVFVLAGAEDLVPVARNGSVVTYRPRLDAGYARIERHEVDDHSYWVVTTRDNVRSVFGYSDAARIAESPSGPVYRWLLEWTDDDRGNVIACTYKAEDNRNVAMTASELHRKRTNRYLKGIGYGALTQRDAKTRTQPPSNNLADYPLVVLFDYGDHAAQPSLGDNVDWPARQDAFSSYRAGFEIRTHRLCQRVLMLHRFGTGPHEVVRSTELGYTHDAAATTLRTVMQVGWKTGEAPIALRPITFEYASATMTPRTVRVDPSVGVIDGNTARWVDLDAEGLPGILREQGGAWWYQSPTGDGWQRSALVRTRPNASLADGWQLQDLDGDGQVDLVKIGVGSWTRRDAIWREYRRFDSNANIDFADPNLRFVDLNGDGLPDILVHSGGVFRWHPSLGVHGHGAELRTPQPLDADGRTRPIPLFSTAREVVALADMTGDGLADIVHIRPGAVSYWPNLGYGRFGPRVVMVNAPALDTLERFEPRRVVLADLDGTGAADLIYFSGAGTIIARNRAGNSFGDPLVTNLLPPPHGDAAPSVMDLWGRGVACLVQTSIARSDTARGEAIRVVELFDQKPYLLTSIKNGLGAETSIEYSTSTAAYLADRATGRPWVTRLPFPVHVVSKLTVADAIAGTTLATTYRYHHGHYDGVEREFRGFAMVEQEDAETLAAYVGRNELPSGEAVDQSLYIPPALTRSWFHTGLYIERGRVSKQLATEYFLNGGYTLPDSPLPPNVLPDEARQACRVLRGKPLRVEVYALDGNPVPYQIIETNYTIGIERHAVGKGYAVFSVAPRETITIALERAVDDPRIAHELVLAVDQYGDVLDAVSIAYPRRPAVGVLDEQKRLWALRRQSSFVHFDSPSSIDYRVGVPIDTTSYEMIGLASDGILTFADVVTAAASTKYDFAEPKDRKVAGQYLIERSRMHYCADDGKTVLPYGSATARALATGTSTLAFNGNQLVTVWGPRAADIVALASNAGYLIEGDEYWAWTGRVQYDPSQFHLPTDAFNPFGGFVHIEYEPALLLPHTVTDAATNTTTLETDYRLLATSAMVDANGTRHEVTTDALGVVRAARILGAAGDGGTIATFDYELGTATTPTMIHTLAPEQFDGSGLIAESWLYTDGSGRETQRKMRRAADGNALPFVATSRTIYDNKGRAVKQYEPYFSTLSTFDAEDALATHGVTMVLHYDPLGRLVRTDAPDGTYSSVTRTAWNETLSDAIDTLTTTSPWVTDRAPGKFAILPALENAAANAALKLAGTPTVNHIDALGRTIASVADGGPDEPAPERYVTTSQSFDVEGALRLVNDGRQIDVSTYRNDVAGRVLYELNVDAGPRWTLYDALSAPIYIWQDDRRVRMEYDFARRLIGVSEWRDGEAAEVLRERIIYRDSADAPTNGVGRVRADCDGGGVIVYSYDFAGRMIESARHVLSDATLEATWELGWNGDGALPTGVDNEALRTTYSFDAQSRERTRQTHVGTRPSGVVRRTYNIAGQLDTVSADAAGTKNIALTESIEYDEKGRRQTVVHGNGCTTSHHYDPLTFRLRQKTLNRGTTVAQAWQYVYDPVGNITAIVDTVGKEFFYDGTYAPPSRNFTYDGHYRLRIANGREHVAQSAPDQRDVPKWRQLPYPLTSDQEAIVPYREEYQYDRSGNLRELKHVAATPWKRTYDVADGSNQLQQTRFESGEKSPVSYDGRGNIKSLPHLATMKYNYRSQLVVATRTHTGNSKEVTTSDENNPVQCGYDLRGQRVFKRASGSTRIYLEGFDLYREDGGLERETLNISDDHERIALIESRIDQPEQLIRHQHNDHLGSASEERSDLGKPLTYEEFHPFGTTALQLGTLQKRYRFTAQERDEETGLQYHHHRYYAPWLARWASPDPKGFVDGTNLYSYCASNPVVNIDPRGTDAGVSVDFRIDSDPVSHTAQAKASLSLRFGSYQLDLSISGQRMHPDIDASREGALRAPAAPSENQIKLARASAQYEAGRNKPQGIDAIGQFVFFVFGAVVGFVEILALGGTALAASLATAGGFGGALGGGMAADALISQEMDPHVRELAVGGASMAGGAIGGILGGALGQKAIPSSTPKGLLPGEGLIGTYDDLIYGGSKGDNLTPHHVPSAKHMSQHGVSYGDGIAINLEHPAPGAGGRHRATFTYGTSADLNLSPRDALAAGIRDLRRIFQADGVYSQWLRAQLQEFISLSKTTYPELFGK